MTAWRLIPLNNGPHIRVRVFAGVDLAHVTEVGELMLRPAEYGDLATRIGNTDGFSTETGRPLAVVSVVSGYELLDETTRQLRAVEAEYDATRQVLSIVEAERDKLAKQLAALHATAGRYPCIRCGEPTTPDRPYCDGCAPPALPGPVALHGCDDCCAEPGEPHAWPGCSGIASVEAGERTEDAPDGAP